MEAKVRSLPLFPLNVVLFPGQTLPLHIFESRYRVMIKHCAENKEPFGVVLAYDPDTPVEFGTSARVTELKVLPDGRMDIVTVGVERFKIHHLRHSEHGYLIGDVTFEPVSGEASDELVAEVGRRARRYLRLLTELSGAKFRFAQFPSEARELALFTAIALRLPVDIKQELLDHHRLDALLRDEQALLGDENRQMTLAAGALQPPDDDHGFCLN